MDKNEAIKLLLKNAEKKYGAGALTQGSVGFKEITRSPSGSFNLDMILGGGWPEGRIFEIYGPESSGKTSIALLAVSAFQAAGKVCAYIDAENALDPKWVERLGVSINDMLFSQPTTGEEALDIVEDVVTSGVVDFVVVDSVSALVPRAELDGEMADSNVALQARMMSKAMRKLAAAANKSKCSILFINQLREKVGVMFGNPETTTGGRALKFYSSIRIESRKELIKEGAETIGQKINLKTTKNKTYPPYKQCTVLLNYKNGFDISREILTTAVELGIIEKSGSWYSYKGEKIGQGETNATSALESMPKEFEEIKEAVKNKVKEQLAGSQLQDEFEDKEM